MNKVLSREMLSEEDKTCVDSKRMDGNQVDGENENKRWRYQGREQHWKNSGRKGAQVQMT